MPIRGVLQPQKKNRGSSVLSESLYDRISFIATVNLRQLHGYVQWSRYPKVCGQIRVARWPLYGKVFFNSTNTWNTSIKLLPASPQRFEATATFFTEHRE